MASLVYEEGLARVNTTSVGGLLGTSRTGPSVSGGAAKNFGVQQTELSKRAAPPETSSFSTVLVSVATFCALVSLGGLYWFWIPTVALAALAWAVFSEENEEQEAAMKRWRALRVCQRCGTFYAEPEASV